MKERGLILGNLAIAFGKDASAAQFKGRKDQPRARLFTRTQLEDLFAQAFQTGVDVTQRMPVKR